MHLKSNLVYKPCNCSPNIGVHSVEMPAFLFICHIFKGVYYMLQQQSVCQCQCGVEYYLNINQVAEHKMDALIVSLIWMVSLVEVVIQCL